MKKIFLLLVCFNLFLIGKANNINNIQTDSLNTFVTNKTVSKPGFNSSTVYSAKTLIKHLLNNGIETSEAKIRKARIVMKAQSDENLSVSATSVSIEAIK